jgi:hypothetical protein
MSTTPSIPQPTYIQKFNNWSPPPNPLSPCPPTQPLGQSSPNPFKQLGHSRAGAISPPDLGFLAPTIVVLKSPTSYKATGTLPFSLGCVVSAPLLDWLGTVQVQHLQTRPHITSRPHTWQLVDLRSPGQEDCIRPGE